MFVKFILRMAQKKRQARPDAGFHAVLIACLTQHGSSYFVYFVCFVDQVFIIHKTGQGKWKENTFKGFILGIVDSLPNWFHGIGTARIN